MNDPWPRKRRHFGTFTNISDHPKGQTSRASVQKNICRVDTTIPVAARTDHKQEITP
jgi:hypothetical protein